MKKPTPEQKQVKKEFAAYQKNIAKQISDLKIRIKEFSVPENKNWSGIGSFNHVLNELTEIKNFITIRKKG